MNFACVDTFEMNFCQLCIILQSILCPDVQFFSGPTNQFSISLKYIDMLFCCQKTSVHILFMH